MHITIRELAIVNLAAFYQILEKAFRHVIMHLVEDAPGQSRIPIVKDRFAAYQ